MKNDIKCLALKMAELSSRDQKWVFKKLSQKQKLLFEFFDGPALCKEAQRFSQLPNRMDFFPKALPRQAHSLKHFPPILSAIILKHGRFDWQNLFLETMDSHSEILKLMKANSIKTATQHYFFENWQQSMEATHE